VVNGGNPKGASAEVLGTGAIGLTLAGAVLTPGSATEGVVAAGAVAAGAGSVTVGAGSVTAGAVGAGGSVQAAAVGSAVGGTGGSGSALGLPPVKKDNGGRTKFSIEVASGVGPVVTIGGVAAGAEVEGAVGVVMATVGCAPGVCPGTTTT
jgi:hypothetical protein